MSLIWTILIGFVVGLLARALTPGDQPHGFIITTLLGIGGSLAATYGGAALGIYHPGESAGFIASLIGAIVLVLAWSMIARRRPAP